MVKIPRVHHKTKTKNEELVVFQSGKVMRDFSKNGKEQPWQKRKIENVKYADYLEILEFKKAHKVKECAEVLEFKIDDNGEKKLYRVWFCKSRLCPLCSWRRAKKAAFQLQQILQEAHNQQPKAEFIFLTLTIKNTTEKKELRAELQKLRRGVVKLFQYKKVKKNLLGFIRATEITVNKNDQSYNQHVHVLAMFSPHYFSGRENYLAQSEWQKLWRKAIKVDYDPVIFVEKVKAKPEKGITVSCPVLFSSLSVLIVQGQDGIRRQSQSHRIRHKPSGFRFGIHLPVELGIMVTMDFKPNLPRISNLISSTRVNISVPISTTFTNFHNYRLDTIRPQGLHIS